MKILLTNDDGVHAPGLEVLEAIARQFSDDIWICAPDEEQSGMGHALTLTRPVRLRKHSERRFSVTGTPTDSVTMGLRQVMDGVQQGVGRIVCMVGEAGLGKSRLMGELKQMLNQFVKCKE